MEIILYSNGCPLCKALKEKLDKENISYKLCSDVALMLSKGYKSVPLLEVNEQILTYPQALKWIQEEG